MENKDLIEILEEQIIQFQLLQKSVENDLRINASEKIKLAIALSKQIIENVETIYAIEHNRIEKTEDDDRNNETTIIEDGEETENKEIKLFAYIDGNFEEVGVVEIEEIERRKDLE